MRGNPPQTVRLSPAKHLVFGLVTVLLTSGLILGAAELYVRRTQPFYTPETLKAQSLQFDPSALARYNFRPNQQLAHPAIRINAQGYRGADFELEKQPGMPRIMFLGGSMVFTINTPDGEDWPALTGKALEELGHPNVEAMNAAVTGSTTADVFGRFYGELWAYHPDYVVICLAWNDLKLLKYYRRGTSLLRASRPVEPNTDPRQNYRNAVDRVLSRSSQVYVRLRSRYYAWSIPSGTEGAIERSSLIDEFDPAWLDQYRMNLKLLADAVKHAGGTPVFVTQPTLVMEDNTAADRERIGYHYIGFTHERLAEILAACRDAVLEVAREQGAPSIDAYAEMSGQSRYFMDHVHTSPEGSEAIARIVAGELKTLLEASPNGP